MDYESHYHDGERYLRAEEDGTFEADNVSLRINALLAEKAFTFSPTERRRNNLTP